MAHFIYNKDKMCHSYIFVITTRAKSLLYRE
jgi:hypothetical protein